MPDLFGAMDATSSSIEATNATNGFPEADAAGGGEGSLGMSREVSNTSTPQPFSSQTDQSSALPPVERYIKDDGKIGVILSKGHHGGWSTQIRRSFEPRDPSTPGNMRRMEEIAVFDKEVVAAVLEGNIPQARTIAIAKMGLPNESPLSVVDLRVAWVAPGDQFEVVVCPGFERIRMKNLIDFWRA